MDSTEDNKQFEIEQLLSKINVLEKRIKNIESELGIKTRSDSYYLDSDEDKTIEVDQINEEEIGLESRIGGYGLALLGTIVLMFGIVFLSQYIHNNGYPLLSSLLGYVSIGGILFLSYFTKKKVPHLSAMFNIIGQFLLYYITLRLHFFITNPVITNDVVALLLIFFVIFYQVFIAFKNKSELFAGIAIVLTLVTGVISGITPVALSMGPIVAAGSVYLFFKFGWWKVMLLSLFLVYLNFVGWFLNTPLAPAPNEIIPYHYFCHFYLMLSAGIFSLLCLTKQSELISKNFILGSIILNGFNFSVLLLIFVTTFFYDDYTVLFLIISGFCMGYSILLKFRSEWKFAPAFYAMYGFMAISLSVYGIFKLPYTFLLLTIQSLYVLVIALWFRSKIIININSFLFVMLLITYLANLVSIDIINFAFAGASFITAKVLNWKKNLLDIKTEWFRNLYLFITFLMVLYALYEFVADHYVTLSWTITAIIYFIYSVISHNVKYRWMAIATMIAAAFYLFLIDLSRISLAYRIIAFLFLSVISIIISLYYNRKKAIGSDNNEE